MQNLAQPTLAAGLAGIVATALTWSCRDETGQLAEHATTHPRVVDVSVVYDPQPSNPLPNPTAATHGTRVLVTIRLDRGVDGWTPSLTGSNADARLRFQPSEADSPEFVRFAATVDRQSHPDGRYSLGLQLGRSSSEADVITLALPNAAVLVDTTADPLQIRQDDISFLRAPWGNLASPGTERYGLQPFDGWKDRSSLAPETFELGGSGQPSAVRLWGPSEALLGFVEPADDGRWRREDLEVAGDPSYLRASGLDHAGNEADRVRIRHTWHVVTTAGVGAPGTAHELRTGERTVDPVSSDLRATDPGPARNLDGEVIQIAGSERWRIVSEPDASERDCGLWSAAVAVDRSRDRLVAVGRWRTDDEQWQLDVCEWRDRAWVPVEPESPRPPPRSGHSIVYDGNSEALMVFGGQDEAGPRNDQWLWDGRRWTEVPSGGERPSARRDAGMAWDSVERRVVLFGGGPHRDTWIWNGSDWRQLSFPEARRPPPTTEGSRNLTFDQARNRVVLLVEGLPSRIWELDEFGWGESNGRFSTGLGRGWTALAYDERQDRVFVVVKARHCQTSGSSPSCWFETQLHSWDGSSSEQLEVLPGDVFEGEAAFAYFPRLGGLVGVSSFELTETISIEGGSWRRRLDEPPRFGGACTVGDACMLGSAGRERVMVFGRSDSYLSAFTPGPKGAGFETWVWNGRRWAEFTDFANSPPARIGASMAHDPHRDRLVLFGGRACREESCPNYGDLWEWDGSAWNEVAVAGGPSARVGHAMAFDPERREIILFGGATNDGDSAETWSWDGVRWVELQPDAPPEARRHAAIATDSSNGRVVLFGGQSCDASGCSAHDDTWAWSNGAWRELATAAHPPAELPSGMAGDETGRVLLVLGTETWEFAEDTWSRLADGAPGGSVAYVPARGAFFALGGWTIGWRWDGSEWIEVDEYEEPTPDHGSIVFDRHRDRIVLFDTDRETWEWEGSKWTLSAEASGPESERVQLVYDEAREEVVAVESNETWTYDGAGWRDVTSSTPPPWGDSEASLAFDPDRGRLIRHVAGRTWEWDGARWFDATPSSPLVPADDGLVSTHDRRRQRTVLVESSAGWEWDGASWTRFDRPEAPPGEPSTTLLYHEERGTTVYMGRWTECTIGFFGGQPTCQSSEHAWEWDGSSWQTWPELQNGLRVRPSTYDSLRGRIVHWGGRELAAFGPPETALIQLSVDPPEMQADEVVSGLALRGYCGARRGRDRVGARLEVWTGRDDAGAWQVVDRNSASTTEASGDATRLDHQVVEGAVSTFDEFVQTDGRIHTRCRPDAPPGPGVPIVTLDYAEVGVRTSAPPAP